MEVNRELLYPFFEGYKFDPDNSPQVDYYPLEYPVPSSSDVQDSSFQVLADKIYENRLKCGAGKKFYYLSKARELVSFCKESFKSEIIARSVDTFAVFNDEFILLKQGLEYKIINSSDLRVVKEFTFTFAFEEEVKILGFKVFDGGKICILMHEIGRGRRLNENPAFKFYRCQLEMDNDGYEYRLVVWSHSRPVINFIDRGGKRIIIGMYKSEDEEEEEEEEGVKYVNSNDDGTVPEMPKSVFDFDKEDDNYTSNSTYDCIINEFKKEDDNSDDSDDFGDEEENFLHYLTEETVSGSYYKDLHVPCKYLYDVIIKDFSCEPPLHVSTFPALNFIQSGKPDKKYSVFSGKWAFILESYRNIFCYRRPEGRDAKHSQQYFVQLEEEINGWYIDGSDEDVIYVLGLIKIYKITLKQQ